MDLYAQFKYQYNLLVDSYHRDKSSKKTQDTFTPKLIDTVNTNINKLCLNLNLHKNFKYFYLYMLNLFIQNLANAMINNLKRVMPRNITTHIKNIALQKNHNNTRNVVNDKDIDNEINLFESKINTSTFGRMYHKLTNTNVNICYDYFAVICFISYIETNSFEFVNTLTDKIISGETSINLNFDNNLNSFIPNYTVSNNNFCIDCINCENCLCCYNCHDCAMCNCCINCKDSSLSMYCMNSLNVRNSFYVNKSKNIFYCHKCCSCNTCYYSDHITNCVNVMYVSNVANLYNNQKSFIQFTSKNLNTDKENGKNKHIRCFQRRISNMNKITRESIAESVDENDIVLNEPLQNQSIPQLDIYYQYTQIVETCIKHSINNKIYNSHVDVNNDFSLIYGCNYPSYNDVYFYNNGVRDNNKWNNIQLEFCKRDNNRNSTQCQKFMDSEFNPLNDGVRKRSSYYDDYGYYKHARY